MIDLDFLDCLIDIIIENALKSIGFNSKSSEFNQKMDKYPINLIENRSKLTQNHN